MIKIKRIIDDEIEKLDVTGITLLSIEEYRMAKKYIPLLNKWWWLRSPGHAPVYAAFVHPSGCINVGGDFVNAYEEGNVRPALRVKNLEAMNLNPGDKILNFAGYDWTVVTKNLILCDESIGCYCFNEDWNAPDANNFEKSDIKKYIEEWWKNHENR